MLIVEVSMSPLGENASVSKQVAKIVDIIDQSGLSYQLGPMGTCIEGEWKDIMNVIQKCYEQLKNDSERISFFIKGDWRKGNSPRLQNKVNKVEDILGRKLKK